MAEKKSREKKMEELVKKQGDAFMASYNLHMEEIIHTVKKVDDYIITAAIEPAVGMYVMGLDKSLEWESPQGFGDLHVEIVVQDRDDRRFVPHLEVSAKVYDKEHKVITESEAPFMWHPYIFHYGFDMTVPDEGDYFIEVRIKAPKFHRHKKDHGKRYSDDIEIKLSPLRLNPPVNGDEEDILNQ
jgi:uncharacterized protein involved in high-affinity Fe2+ transport